MQSSQNVDDQFREEKVSSWSASEKRFLVEHYGTVSALSGSMALIFSG